MQGKEPKRSRDTHTTVGDDAVRRFDAPGSRQFEIHRCNAALAPTYGQQRCNEVFVYGCGVSKGPINGVQGARRMQMEGTRNVSASHHASVGKFQPVLSRRKPAAPLWRPDRPPSVLFEWKGINETDHAIRLAQCALSESNGMVRLVDTLPLEQYAGRAIWTPEGSRWFPPGQDWLELADGRVMRGGHIPGALHLHASSTLNAVDWTFRDPAAIHEYFIASLLTVGRRESGVAAMDFKLARTRGIEPTHRVITYCGVGISASLGLFALHLAGYRNLALYDASWEEWGTDPNHPIE